MLWSSALFSAEQGKDDTTDNDDLELTEVQVTGTRIQLPNVTAANPVTSITKEEMDRLGIVNVADALTTLVPQNISTYMPGLTGDNPTYTGNDTGGIGGAGSGNSPFDRGSLFVGSTIANLRGLDPMFGSRTLTMIDGRRVVSTSNQADVVDLNIIPSNLLERMDVVTGGASATYGSGAMAGVVNLVLNRRLNGVNLDLDYGINEAGDGGSPHVSMSGGTDLFGGKGHALLGLEWQDQHAIRNCAAARDWCAESRALFSNSTGSLSDPTGVLSPLQGFEGYPARVEVTNLRYSQFAPTGTIYSNNINNTSGYRFTADGTGVEGYSYGYRGGTSAGTVMNGDGPLATSGTTLRPSSERRSAFSNFEFDFSSTLTGYVQASYATTHALNKNPYTTGNACVRFNTPGVAGTPAAHGDVGTVVIYDSNGTAVFTPNPDGSATGGGPYTFTPRSTDFIGNANFRAFVQAPTIGFPNHPYWYAETDPSVGATPTNPPTFSFGGHATGVWHKVQRTAAGPLMWLLYSITLTEPFDDPGVPAVLPTNGHNAYAFLNQLGPEALTAVQQGFGNASTTGATNSALVALYGGAPCGGFTTIKKVWNPQVNQWTSQQSNTWRAVSGLRGRFGSDWRWEAYYQYGATDSTSKQRNVMTNLSFAFAMDAVIDDRLDSEGNPVVADSYGKPICRITRDGVPIFDNTGRPLSDPAGLAAIAAGCQPLNIFGTSFSSAAYAAGYDAAATQQAALDYAFKDNISDGSNSLQTLSFTTSGTLLAGWAGPLTGAFGIELRQDSVDNVGSRGPYYERADFSRAWGDAFGGRTRVAEGYTELNLPLVSGVEGVDLWTVNAALRWGFYNNKGGAGTTGQSLTQSTPNWKFQTEFAPFDFLRFRVTRSHDLRAAGYRDLFLNQPGIPDQASGVNPWRERTPDSDENQRERWGFVRVGNAHLKPEKSDTLTLGMVLRPGGWAQGMNLTVDYYSIRVRDAIYTPFTFLSPITSCWENSGNVPATYFDGGIDPDAPGVNGLFNPDLPECREIAFANALDESGEPIPGSIDLTDIVSYNASRPANNLPLQRRGLDLALNYNFPLSRAIEGLPGSVSLSLRGTRALEASGIQQSCGSFTTIDGTTQCVDTFTPVQLVGQIRSSVYVPGVSASPKWAGNISASYLYGNMTATLSARYIGAAHLDNTWSDDPASPAYRNDLGQLLNGSVDNNRIDPYFNVSLNGSYNLKVADLRQFQIFGSINNLFDKSPPFTGGGISGASAGFNDTMGRAYRMGMRLKF
jgi:outer membrane receptor protein involved in Fe transport